jgi:hypothetical protein
MNNPLRRAMAATFALALGYQLDASAEPPPLGLPRLPEMAISDFKTDISDAPVASDSDALINWHASVNSYRRTWLTLGPWGDVDFTPKPDGAEWGALHLLQIDDSYPFSDVLVSLYPGESDGVSATDGQGRRWARNFYRIPSVIQSAPHYLQGGWAATYENLDYDRHLTLYNSETNTFDEFFQARYKANDINPWSGARGYWVASGAARFNASSLQTMHSRPPYSSMG